MDYWRAVEVEDVVQEYRKFHPEIIGAEIFCLFREKATMSDGNPIVGKISKVSARYRPMMEVPYDYILEIAADAWMELDVAKREAWVDHLLRHAYGEEDEKTGEMSYKLRKPEVSVFPDVVNRHGVGWMTGLAKLRTLPAFQKPTQAVDPKSREDLSNTDPLLEGL